MLNSRNLGVVVVASVVVALSGCSFNESDSASGGGTRTVSFSVNDQTASDYYTLGANATGTVGEFGNMVSVPINITNENQIVINPVATIEFADGSTLRCEETDLRRLPSLVGSRTEVEMPCPGDFPDDADGATVTIVDDYK